MLNLFTPQVSFALRKLFNAALACLGHQHPINGCKDLLVGFRNEFGMTGVAGKLFFWVKKVYIDFVVWNFDVCGFENFDDIYEDIVFCLD